MWVSAISFPQFEAKRMWVSVISFQGEANVGVRYFPQGEANVGVRYFLRYFLPRDEKRTSEGTPVCYTQRPGEKVK